MPFINNPYYLLISYLQMLILLTSMKGGISIFNFFMSISITVSHMALIRSAATLSNGVCYKFTITNFCFLCATSNGISAAGVTRSEDPMAMHTSAISEFRNPSDISFSGRFSPKFIMLSYKGFLHFGSSQYLPV